MSFRMDRLDFLEVQGTLKSLLQHYSSKASILRRPWFDSWIGKICWRRDRLPLKNTTPLFLGFLCGSAGKESASSAGDLCSIPGLGRSPREWKGHPLQYSGLENSMDYPWGCKVSEMTEWLLVHWNGKPAWSIWDRGTHIYLACVGS